MDISNNVAMCTTTVQIPVKLRMDIKARDMTVKGALIQGWAALEEKQRWQGQLAETNRYLDRAKSTIAELRQRITLLEEKNGA